MRWVLVVIALVAACSSPAPGGPDQVDAGGVEVDAAVDAPLDAPECPPSPPPALPPLQAPGAPPWGRYWGRWKCMLLGGCAGQAEGDFTFARGLTVDQDGAIAWYQTEQYTGELLMVRGVATGDCWRVPRDPVRCVAAFDVCRCEADLIAACADLARYDFATHAWQRWHWPR